jgi:curli biogenesis system outer membrane secretion channel CsgG
MLKKILVASILLCFVASFVVTPDTAAKSRRKTKRVEVIEEVIPAPTGPKKTIAVMDFENKAGGSAQWNLGTGMAEMLTTALVDSGHFIVVERQAITKVLNEQDFGASGRTRSGGAPKIGELLNAQILVSGAVTEFATRTSGGGQGISFKGINLGMSGSNAHVAVNIRLYDTTTGEVLDSQRVEGKASSSGITGGYTGSELGGFNFGTGTFKKTPLGKATQMTINKAVYYIITKMENVPWEGKIVTVKGDQVYINAGQRSNLLNGMEFSVWKKGEELIDPDSGISLGSEDKKIGAVQIVDVEEKFSKAIVTAGSISSMGRGDLVKLK